MEQPKAIFCWSGGKDSAYALYKVLSEAAFDVRYLLTTLNANFKRVSMHGVSEALLDAQADSVGIPLIKVWVKEGNNSEYEAQMEQALLRAKSEGIHHVIFGDIFLEDLRAYRESNLAKVGMKAVFPLWKKDTTRLIGDFIEQGFKTITCCVNDAYLGEQWAGKEIDAAFVNALPATADPCGENGEYHTFCYEGPLFRKKIAVRAGEIIYRPLDLKLSNDGSDASVITKGFWFCDLKQTSEEHTIGT
ncbi:MAG: Dph6-related ATP pyrophosphatase [Bacteroidia bacterium]